MIEVRTRHPQGGSSMVLSKTKKTAEAYLCSKRIDAVVTMQETCSFRKILSTMQGQMQGLHRV